MQYPIYFLIAIAILVTVHEFGHFATAVALGVKVTRFSIGFGPRLVGWTSNRLGTEFVVSLLPFGGYVKFLDSSDDSEGAAARSGAINSKPLRVRAAIVLGGPIANFLLAIVLYSGVNWFGMEQTSATLGVPVAASLAHQAGVKAGERVVAASFAGQDFEPIQSFEDLRWTLTKAALDHQDLHLKLVDSLSGHERSLLLPLSGLAAQDVDAALFRKIGILMPLTAPVIGAMTPGGAAQEAGLLAGDLVSEVSGVAIADAGQLRELIRNSASSETPSLVQQWTVVRNSVRISVPITLRAEVVAGMTIGRVGAQIGAPPAKVLVRYGLWDSLSRAIARTWEVSVMSIQMMGKILAGSASLKNLSGPITIAEFVGQSASVGLLQFALSLAVISVSLGVLNLLPIPVLDGGHLMYYLWEALTGKPVSESWMEQLVKVGFVVLLMMMSVAVFNDVTRWLG